MAELFPLARRRRARRHPSDPPAARSRRSAVILEKDIWVCWVLDGPLLHVRPPSDGLQGAARRSPRSTASIDRFFGGRRRHPRLPRLRRRFSTRLPTVPAALRPGASANASGTASQAMFATPSRPRSMMPPGASRPTAATTSMSAKTARPSALPIRPRSRRRTATSRARSCWSSAVATSSIRTSATRSSRTSPP